MSPPPDRILFVGIGSPNGDDQIGWHVADVLSCEPLLGVSIRKAAVPADLLDWVDGIDLLGVCDACRSGSPAGTVHRLDWQRSPQPAMPPVIPGLAGAGHSSSHAFDIPTVLNLAHCLGRLPDRVIVWAIEGDAFNPDGQVSAHLENRLPEIAAAIRRELLQV